jgi:peptidoglycan-N-acetylglucosamine deacetylase
MAVSLRASRHTMSWGMLQAAATIGLGIAAIAFLGQTPSAAAPRASACQDPARSLGVSRIVEIDTSKGPQLGHQQYKDIEFLAKGEVVLTFDDGPLRPYTQPIVDALEAQCTKATFFMVGSQALADPDMVRQIIRKGHTVGTHTWSHANLRKSTPLKARQEIELGFSAVAAAAGQPISPFFRFPFLADTKAMLSYAQTRAFGAFSIEVDSLDYKTKSAAAVHQDVLNQLAEFGKGIILFHDIQPATAQALPGLLEALRAKGYKVVHIKPKTMATTLPEFDALARDSQARKVAVAAAQPLAPRGVTWGAASPSATGTSNKGWGTTTPSVVARNGQPTLGQPAPSPQVQAAGVTQQQRGAIPAQLPSGAAATVAGAIGPNSPGQNLPGQSAAGLPGVGVPSSGGFPRVARERPSEDWRDKIFSR